MAFCLLAVRAEVAAILDRGKGAGPLVLKAANLLPIFLRLWSARPDRFWKVVAADQGLSQLKPLLRARIDGEPAALDAEIEALGFSGPQVAFAHEWATRATSLIGDTASSLIPSAQE